MENLEQKHNHVINNVLHHRRELFYEYSDNYWETMDYRLAKRRAELLLHESNEEVTPENIEIVFTALIYS